MKWDKIPLEIYVIIDIILVVLLLIVFKKEGIFFT